MHLQPDLKVKDTMAGLHKPFIDDTIIDTYGTAGVINPKAKYKVVIEAHADEISCLFITLQMKDLSIYEEMVVAIIRLHLPKEEYSHQKRIVKAVFGWLLFILGNQKRRLKTNNIFLDCGCKSKVRLKN